MNMPLVAFEDKKMNPLPLKGSVIGANSIDVNLALIDKFFVGKEVRVYWSSVGHQLNADGHFVTSICIRGKLEHQGEWYRVLVNNDTYCYFAFEDILTMMVRSKESKRPNSIALISPKNN
tara:strand:- start:295 stop:654 length:360 start_codon:yes stop_codon:yes gene_type:complete